MNENNRKTLKALGCFESNRKYGITRLIAIIRKMAEEICVFRCSKEKWMRMEDGYYEKYRENMTNEIIKEYEQLSGGKDENPKR